jgi:SAM-dependent methyltransferase
MPSIEIVPDEPAVDRVVVEHIRRHSQGKDRIEILEAGCGRRWPYDLDGLPYVLTGVDLDAEALRIRQQVRRDLHHVVLGDLRSVHFPTHRFDIIYSSFVLEHVPQTRLVLANFLRWLKPGGLVILKFPDRDSVYGFVTRLTPFWFHVLYKRHVVGNRNAGKPGYGPYRTVHEEVIARKAFQQFIRKSGLTVRQEYGFGTLGGVQGLLARVGSWLSLGRLSADYYNLLYILESPPAPEVAAADSSGAWDYGAAGGVSSIARRSGASPIEARSAAISST